VASLAGACILDTTGDVPIPDDGLPPSGGADCIAASECPVAPPCWVATCAARECVYEAALEGTACGELGACDGAGRCASPLGTECETASTCASAHCADGRCCATVCPGSCNGCDEEGACAPHPVATDPEGTCDPGTCDGAGACATGIALEFGAVASTDGDVVVHSIAPAPQGGAFVVGRFTETVAIGASKATSLGEGDAFAARIDPQGDVVWLRSFGGPGPQALTAIDTFADGGILVAGHGVQAFDLGCPDPEPPQSGFDAIVARLDDDGGCVWQRRYGGASGDQLVIDAAVTSDGGAVLAGVFDASIALDEAIATVGAKDGYVVRLSSSGKPLWHRTVATAGEDRVLAVAVGDDDAVAFVADTTLSVDLGFGLVANAGELDAHVVTLNADGSPRWARSFAVLGAQQLFDVLITPAGDVVTCGNTTGVAPLDFENPPGTSPDDAFLVVLDSNNEYRFARRYASAGLATPNALALDGAGNLVVAGTFFGQLDLGTGPLVSAGADDVFVAKLTLEGTPLWAKRFGDPWAQRASAVGIGVAREVWLAGQFENTIDFVNGAPLVNAGAADGYWARLRP
jgi:hypothetical protein